MLTEQNKDTIIATLSRRVEMLEELLPEREERAYRRGFHDSIGIELHVMRIEGNDEPMSKESLAEIKDGIRRQIFESFEPVLPADIRQWLRDCVYEDNLIYHNFKKKIRKW